MTKPTIERPLFIAGYPIPLLLSPAQAAHMLGIERHAVIGLLECGHLREKKIEGYKNFRRRIVYQSIVDYCNDDPEPQPPHEATWPGRTQARKKRTTKDK